MDGRIPVLAAAALLSTAVCGCSAADPAAEQLRQAKIKLSFNLAMVSQGDTEKRKWCTAGTARLGDYDIAEGDFGTDPANVSRYGNLQMPLFRSDADHAATVNYLAFTYLIAERGPSPWPSQRCYAFDDASLREAHVTYKVTERRSGMTLWNMSVPIGDFTPSVTFINEFKLNRGAEFTCRSYNVVYTYHGLVRPLGGRRYALQAVMCLDPRDKQWHGQQFAWART